MIVISWAVVSAIGFFGVLFMTFFFWNRVVARSENDTSIWSTALIGSLLACALFITCFALGVWFSIARLKGDGWILSA